MTALEHEYEYLVERAIRGGNPVLAKKLKQFAWEHFNIVVEAGPQLVEDTTAA